MRVTTESGTVYEFHDDMVRRTEPGDPLRRDGEWIALLKHPMVEVGLPMHMLLDLRGDGVITSRVTTPVVSIDRWTP